MKISNFLILSMITCLPMSAMQDLKYVTMPADLKQGPRTQPKISGLAYNAERAAVPMTPKQEIQEIANFKKQIAATHTSMLKLVDKIAGTNLAKKIQLLQNISMHEQQSERSLMNAYNLEAAETAEGKEVFLVNHERRDQFSGCPACG